MSSFDPDLRDVLLIKSKAQAAASTEASQFNADGLVAAYMRIRAAAKELDARAFGGGGDRFDEEFPPLEEQRGSGSMTMDAMASEMSRSQNALVLLGQLRAWAEGYEETLERSARIKEETAAKSSEKLPPGFR